MIKEDEQEDEGMVDDAVIIMESSISLGKSSMKMGL